MRLGKVADKGKERGGGAGVNKNLKLLFDCNLIELLLVECPLRQTYVSTVRVSEYDPSCVVFECLSKMKKFLFSREERVNGGGTIAIALRLVLHGLQLRPWD